MNKETLNTAYSLDADIFRAKERIKQLKTCISLKRDLSFKAHPYDFSQLQIRYEDMESLYTDLLTKEELRLTKLTQEFDRL